MNRLLRSIAPAILMVAAAPWAEAQERAEVQALNAQALTAMEGNQWEEALKLFDRCIETHGADALGKFGPSFGVTWYRKGMCEMRLKRWDAAAKSFEICYRAFPNKGSGEGNIFNKRALLRWGEAAQAGGNPAEAIRLFKKFLEERDKAKDSFDPAPYYIQLALCHFSLGEVREGAENLETAVKNKQRFGTPNNGIVAALQALVTTAIAKRDEATLVGFLKENRGQLGLAPFEMATYSPAFIQLATDALAAGMDAAALSLFQLVPATDEMIDDLRSKIGSMGGLATLDEPGRTLVKAELEASLEGLEKLRREGNPHETIQLGATAVIHEKRGNLRGACAAYEQLELHFPKARQREDNLFNLVRCNAALGESAAVEKYGAVFLEAFPASRLSAAVRRLMLVSLFEGDEYASCIKVASEMLPKLAEGSQDHDVCLYMLGASFEQSGRFDEAAPLLDRHVSTYPASQFAQAALYYQAANRARRQQWAEAAKLLDGFVAKYPDAASDPYLAFALLDRAECHVAADEGPAALEKIDQLEKGFPNSETLGTALGVKGDLFLKQGKRDEAEASYKKSLELTEGRGDRQAAAETIARLVPMLAGRGPEGMKEALPYCDRFWKSYADVAAVRNRMAITQAPILSAGGRGQEALDRLRTVIQESASDPGSMALDSAIRSYARLYSAKQGAEALNQHFHEFPGLKPEDKATRSLMRIAVIEIAEEQLGAGDDAAKAKADSLMKTLFQELKSEFEPKDLPVATLIRTGDFLRSKTSAPRQALPYYEEALARKDAAARFPALLGRATVLAEGNKDERLAALKDLQIVFSESKDATEREDALFWLVMTKMKAGDFAGAGESAERYLADDSGFQARVPEVRLALARAYQERGMINEALATHARVWGESGETIRVSAPAMKAWIQLSWARQAPANASDRSRSDRQAAYEEGLGFIEKTRPLFDKMASIDQETWLEIEKLVAEYGASTDVKPVAKTANPKEPGGP